MVQLSLSQALPESPAAQHKVSESDPARQLQAVQADSDAAQCNRLTQHQQLILQSRALRDQLAKIIEITRQFCAQPPSLRDRDGAPALKRVTLALP